MIGYGQGPGSVPVATLDGADRARHVHASKQAAQFFASLAQAAVQGNITVDIMAVGVAAVNTPLLARIANDSGGTLMLHQGEATPPQ